ncbi:MAG: hypothetical protein WAL45_04730 [Terracidiphilus sp.]
MQVIHPDLLGDLGDQNLAAEITEFSEIACTLESRGGGLLLRKNPLGISGIGLDRLRKRYSFGIRGPADHRPGRPERKGPAACRGALRSQRFLPSAADFGGPGRDRTGDLFHVAVSSDAIIEPNVTAG